jgi:hypothetical protein
MHGRAELLTLWGIGGRERERERRESYWKGLKTRHTLKVIPQWLHPTRLDILKYFSQYGLTNGLTRCDPITSP